MNVGIILSHFNYFISFAHQPTQHQYYYTTSRHRFKNADVGELVYCFPMNLGTTEKRSPEGDWESYFKAAIKLQSLNPVIDPEQLAAYYEEHFEQFISSHRIDMLIAGGTTGFERCGLATAKRLGIRTLCLWEGLFRPNTISYNSDGMNAESSFYLNPSREYLKQTPSNEFMSFINSYVDRIKKVNKPTLKLRQIQGSSFAIRNQIINRWKDRADIERIRLPLSQHLFARLNYYSKRYCYVDIQSLQKPFLFFPLQTHTDSNIIINSDLWPFKLYIDLISQAFENVKNKKDCALVIKEHPLDVFRISYPRSEQQDVHWLAPDSSVSKILQHPLCLGTIVVNSTAGFESLLLNKPVLSLGRAIYNRDGLVEMPKSLDAKSVSESMSNIIEHKVDINNVIKFANTVFNETQIHGSIDLIPNKNEIAAFEEFLKNRY